VDGIRLHYVDRGAGAPVVLLHGNPGFVEDFLPVVDSLASTNRVIAFDRPGHGYSERATAAGTTAHDQVRLIHDALTQLGVSRPIVRESLRILAERAGGNVPADVRAVLDAWWNSYGNVRLYDDLTLIELDDDILLQELLATSSLRGALVNVITPRLVAVEPAAMRPLLGEMERLGYTPRVLEDA